MTITVTKIEAIPHARAKAAASVRIGAVTLHGFIVMLRDTGEAWVSMPAKKSGDRYEPIVEVHNRELSDKIKGAVLDAYRNMPTAAQTEALLAGGGDTRPVPPPQAYRDEVNPLL